MKNFLFVNLLIVLVFFAFGNAKAGTSDNVWGWAWSENIGWISFNCNSRIGDPSVGEPLKVCDGGVNKNKLCNSVSPEAVSCDGANCVDACGVINYGVNIDASGNLAGYGWSENIGLIKFDPAPDFTTGVYPTCSPFICPSGSPIYPAKVNIVTKRITGWARACAGLDDDGDGVPNNCQGPTRTDGWDGWILLGPINDNYTKLLLHANGIDGNKNFADSSYVTKTVTANGNAQVDTAQAEFGGASALFDGLTTTYLFVPDSNDWNFGSGNFTIDFWARWNGTPMATGIMGQSNSGGSALKWAVYWNAFIPANNLTFHIQNPAGTTNNINWAWIPSANTWYHIAIVRSGNSWYLFVNGVQTGGVQTQAVVVPDVGTALRIGADGEGWRAFNGWLDEVRITKGAARWTANFTPVSYEYGVDNGAFVDTGPSPNLFKNWAWGSDVVGWVSLSCLNYGSCPGFYYGVLTNFSFNQPPVAAMSCDGSGCPGSQCNGSWVAYQATADPSPCVYTINNDSTDPDGSGDIVRSEWYLKKQVEPDSSYVLKSNCGGICNYTLQAGLEAENYDIKLYVEDAAGNSDEVAHPITVRGEISAGFMCSLDNSNWKNCESLEISQNQRVYLKDDPALAEHSVASEGASISSRQWKNNGILFDGSSANPSIVLTQASNVIRLTVSDSAGRSDYREHNLAASLPLPDWIEVPPTSFINKILAAISNFLKF